MQKGKGVRGGLCRAVVPVIIIILWASSAYPQGCGLPDAVERGMGQVVLPGISLVDTDSMPGGTIFISSISYSNPYSIEGLDALNIGSMLVSGMLTFRADWASLKYDAYREDRWRFRVYAWPGGATLAPFVAIRMYRLKAGCFDAETGHEVETGLVIKPVEAMMIETAVPLSRRPSGRIRHFTLRFLLRWGHLDLCGDLRFPDHETPSCRWGIRASLSGCASLLAGYDDVSTAVSAGIMLGIRRSTFVFSREYHPVLGGTSSFAVVRMWSR